MKQLMILAVAAGVFSNSPSPAFAGEVTVKGAGAEKCSEWTAVVTHTNETNAIVKATYTDMTGWVLGYWAGRAIQGDNDFLNDIDVADFIHEMDAICKSKPNHSIEKAASEVARRHMR